MNTLPECLRRRCAGCLPGLIALLLIAGCQNSSNGTVDKSAPASTPGRVVTPLPGDQTAPPLPGDSAPLPLPPTEPQISEPPAVVISGANRDVPASMVESKVRVAALLPLSGSRGAVGRSMLDAAMLALNDVAEGNFVLLPFDTGGTDRGAAAAIQGAIDNRVELVIGPLFSTSVASAAPRAREAGINVIAFSNNRIVAQPGVFIAGLLPEGQIDRVVRYAAGRGIRRLGALLPAGAFGDRVHGALRGAAAALGLDLVRVEYFDDDPERTARAVRSIGDYDRRRRDLQNQIKALHNATDEVSRRTLAQLEKLETFGPVPFDALVVAASGAKLTEVAAQLGNYDIDTKTVRLLGIAGWGAPGTGREPALVGAWYADTPNAANTEFSRTFRAMYEADPHPRAVDAYDITALAAILASRDSTDRFSAEILTNSSGFAGSGGLFRFMPDGLPERALEVREIHADGTKLVDPAPKALPAATH